ncbi:MAG: hypothetical protein JO105_10870 [Hyphomicrobiales bacterium]|nr:hypothetical protein [Hyphomicrobiales bacterium]
MKVPGHPHLSNIVDRDEAWVALGDFDLLMKGSDQKVQSLTSATDTSEAGRLMHGFARDHFHLLLVGRYKIREIARGICAALVSKNETVLFNLARSLVEHTAALAYQTNALKKAVNELPKKADIKNLRETIERHRKVAKQLYYNEKGAVHVHDMIKSLAQHINSARRDYEALCEFVHPNYGSNRLVSSGQLGIGQMRSHVEELGPDLGRTHWMIERCAMLADDELNKEASGYLIKIASWVEIACQEGAKLSVIFSVRGAISGDGRTKQTAVTFERARTHHEALEAFYNFLAAQKLTMLSRRAAIEGEFLYDKVATDKGPLWVKYRMRFTANKKGPSENNA